MTRSNNETSFMFSLGDEVEDRLTAVKGIITVRAQHLFGCVRYGVQPQGVDDKMKPFETVWVDEGQITLVTARKISDQIGNASRGPVGDPPGRAI